MGKEDQDQTHQKPEDLQNLHAITGASAAAASAELRQSQTSHHIALASSCTSPAEEDEKIEFLDPKHSHSRSNSSAGTATERKNTRPGYVRPKSWCINYWWRR